MTNDQSRAVLLIVHALPPVETSGTPVIAHEYARCLVSSGCRVAVLAGAGPHEDPIPLVSYLDRESGFQRYETCFTQHLWQHWSLHDASVPSPQYTRVIHRVLEEFRPDLVHILDLANLPSDWPEVIKQRRIPILRQVWNTEDLCGLIEPIWSDGHEPNCPAPLTPERCAECCFRQLVTVSLTNQQCRADLLLRRLTTLREASIRDFTAKLHVKRQQAVQQFTHTFDRVVFPTRSFREFFERTLPLSPSRAVVIEPGMDVMKSAPVAPPTADQPVRLLFHGNALTKKGIEELIDVFSHAELLCRSDYFLDIHGDDRGGVLNRLLAVNGRVRHHGHYPHDRLATILQSGHVGLSPSRFETYHRVTREYLQAGLAVLGSMAFGIPDVVRDHENGLLFDSGHAADFRKAVLAILDDRKLLCRLMFGARQSEIRVKRDEIRELLANYETMLTEASDPAC